MDGMWGEDAGANIMDNKDSFYAVGELDGNPPIPHEDIPINDITKLDLTGEIFPWLFQNKYQNPPLKRISRLNKRSEVVLVPVERFY